MKTMITRMVCMLVVATVACTYSFGTNNAKVKLKDPQVSVNQMGNFLAGKVSKKDSKSSKTKKTETVYVELNGDGSTKKTTVSDILDVKGNDSIADVSFLDNIKNLKGDEKFTKDGDKLVWENKGKNITYQGTTKQEPPISVSITYSLNGEDISAEDLEGKSGELQIQYKFKNNAKTKGHDFVPFFVLGGFILDEETFSNVMIDNGKVADYDESKIVLGYAVPGLDDYLHDSIKGADKYLNKIDLSEAFTISADVKDFTMSMGLIVATSNLGNFNIKDAIDLSEVKSKVNQLQSGADALVDGANQLSDGGSKLKAASPKIKNGSDTLTAGLKKIKKGAKKNHAGNKKFHKALKKGLKSAKKGAKKLSKGTDKLADGVKSINDGAKKLDEGASSLESGSKKLASGISQIKTGFDKKGGILDGSKALKNGTKSANSGVNQLISILQSSPDSLDGQIDSIMAQVKQASGGSITSEAQLAAVVEGINSAVKGGTALETVLASKGLNASTYYALVQAHYSVQTLEAVKAKLSGEVKKHASEIAALKKGMQDLEDGSAALNTGLNTAYGGISTVNQGAASLYSGTSSLKSGTSKLSKGTGTLKTGADTLNTGMTSLYSGVKKMKVKMGEARPKLLSASNQLKKAMEKVYEGSNKLNNGIATYCNGVDTLGDGTKTLADGASKLNNEGIKKITSLFGKKADKAIDKIQNLLDAGSSYKSFSGISKDMDGQVKFIYKTPEIGEWE